MTNIQFLAATAALSGLVLYPHQGFWRLITVVALASKITALAFGFLLHTFWMEWLAIGLVLLYVGLMALNTGGVAKATAQTGELGAVRGPL